MVKCAIGDSPDTQVCTPRVIVLVGQDCGTAGWWCWVTFGEQGRVISRERRSIARQHFEELSGLSRPAIERALRLLHTEQIMLREQQRSSDGDLAPSRYRPTIQPVYERKSTSVEPKQRGQQAVSIATPPSIATDPGRVVPDTRLSRPMDFHHRPLAEPSVRLSPHSAPIRQTRRPYRFASGRRDPTAPERAVQKTGQPGWCGL